MDGSVVGGGRAQSNGSGIGGGSVGREEVPERLRRLLNVASGLNDGLALPVVMAMLAAVGARDGSMATVLGEVGLGPALGIATPWLVMRLEHSRFFSAAHIYEPLHAVAVGLGVCRAF